MKEEVMEQKWVEKRNQQTVFDAVESGSVAETDAVGAGDLCLRYFQLQRSNSRLHI